jgi:FkbM family methyltransferase
MDNQLIFDIGMHLGQDTGYYLHKGYRVVAIDADVRLIERARQEFAEAVRAGQLTLVHCAVAAAPGEIDFHLSDYSVWSSLNINLSNRDNTQTTAVRVPARRLVDLLAEHGTPVYCKIDVEGYDAICLSTLEGAAELPQFISVETECIGEHERITEAEAQLTLDRLHGLGYRRFKLVDQLRLVVLSPADSFYGSPRIALWHRVSRRLGLGNHSAWKYLTRSELNQKHGYTFPEGASGPFGDDLAGEWLDYPSAQRALRRHRHDYHGVPGAKPYGFWCDWHATF